MKKILLSLVTVLCALASNAQTTLDFTSASAWGYADAAAGEYTQVNSGDVLTQGNYKISVAFEEGKNGARFFTHSTAGTINLRLYVGTTLTIETADGSNMSTIEFSGSNLGATYVSADGYDGGTWKGTSKSVTINVIKSTMQINTIKIYEEGSATPASIANTPETAYTTTEAFALIDAGEDLNTTVYVKGTITKVDNIDTGSYGNATYFISDGNKELEIYRGYSFNGDKFTSTEDIQDGDEVIVYGKLVNYKGTYEMTTGSKIYSLNGKTHSDTGGGTIDPELPYTLVGNGTLENPYTTEDIIKGVYKADATVTGVWVKGTILGCVNTSTGSKLSDKDPVASNIALGAEDGTSIIPIQLPFVSEEGSPVRDAINVMNNPSNVGKTVYLYGDVIKYCGVAGLKNTSEYSWDGKTSSIKSISTTSASKIFNLNGQRLSAPQKGINIINGEKVLVK